MTVFSRPTDKHYEALHGITKKNSRTERPVAVFISVLVPSALLVYAICSCFRWSKVEENKNTAKASSLDFSSKSFATKMAWIPLMESGIVAGRYKDFPDWYQCWAPFCENCEVPLPAPGSLQGLRIFVLSSGGEKESKLRDVIRSTWAAKAKSLGAEVAFVLGDDIQQWGSSSASAISSEAEEFGDVTFVDIRDRNGVKVKDSYTHLAFKVSALAKTAFRDTGHGTWIMKVDSDTYVNVDKMALEIQEYRREFAEGKGSWQYAGYHNDGTKVLSHPSMAKSEKQLAWLEVEYGKHREFFPPFAFGAPGWILGHDALSALVAQMGNASLVLPQVNEDAMVGALLEGCLAAGRCKRKMWRPCEFLGGTSFPFASLENRKGCPTLFERIGMAVADDQVDRLRCLKTVTELKDPSIMRDIDTILSEGRVR
uniref:Hexosyltransferase n=1 Tax=Tetraselmis sp. GSL018 TaxID=582737 RepID=A0A061RKT3_9CHLO